MKVRHNNMGSYLRVLESSFRITNFANFPKGEEAKGCRTLIEEISRATIDSFS